MGLLVSVPLSKDILLQEFRYDTSALHAGPPPAYSAPATGEKKAPTITGQSTVAKLPKAQVTCSLLLAVANACIFRTPADNAILGEWQLLPF